MYFMTRGTSYVTSRVSSNSVKMAPCGLAAHSQSLAPQPRHHGQTYSRLSRFTALKYCPINKGGNRKYSSQNVCNGLIHTGLGLSSVTDVNRIPIVAHRRNADYASLAVPGGER